MLLRLAAITWLAASAVVGFRENLPAISIAVEKFRQCSKWKAPVTCHLKASLALAAYALTHRLPTHERPKDGSAFPYDRKIIVLLTAGRKTPLIVLILKVD
ncbi:hypothetical protein RvY_18178 [Ramazzottius varieornatus]|uniref:Secreted protein n=1 Tax=Ramazzottius varieornatus TaxID=947166 RepID=A0A1D1W5C5_RAMVA|nr:hypothetical protein RvY_18178 [Ramazzottius varieornatus]